MKILRISGAVLVLTLPAAAFAATTPTNFQSLAKTAATILNYGAGALLTATFVIYFWSIASNLYKISQGEASGDDLRKSLIWGIVVIFVMVSIWGVLQFLQYSLFGGTGPTSSNGVINYQSQ